MIKNTRVARKTIEREIPQLTTVDWDLEKSSCLRWPLPTKMRYFVGGRIGSPVEYLNNNSPPVIRKVPTVTQSPMALNTNLSDLSKIHLLSDIFLKTKYFVIENVISYCKSVHCDISDKYNFLLIECVGTTRPSFLFL